MQIIYAAPFMLLSVLAFLVCVAVPRWRRYWFQALVAPVAFGFCSIVAAGAAALTSDYLKLGLFTKPWSGILSALPIISIYFLAGFVGSWCAIVAATKITAFWR